jgi:hypothetical protein
MPEGHSRPIHLTEGAESVTRNDCVTDDASVSPSREGRSPLRAARLNDAKWLGVGRGDTHLDPWPEGVRETLP